MPLYGLHGGITATRYPIWEYQRALVIDIAEAGHVLIPGNVRPRRLITLDVLLKTIVTLVDSLHYGL